MTQAGGLSASESDLAALGELAIATGRARGSHDMGASALDILCQATGATAGLILLHAGTGYEAVASRGLRPELVGQIARFERQGARLTALLETRPDPVFVRRADAPLHDDIRAGIAAEGIEALMLAGLRTGGRLTGIFALGWPVAPPPRPGDAIVLQAAAMLGAALENARLVERLELALATERRLVEEQTALQSLTLVAESAEDFHVLAATTIRHIVRVMGADAGTYALISPSDRLVHSAYVGLSPEYVASADGVPASQMTLVRRISTEHGPHVAPIDPSVMDPARQAVARSAGFRTYAALPVRVDDRLEAMIVIYFARPLDEVAYDQRALEAMSQIAGISLANFRLREGLGASEARYRTLFEESPDALVLVSADSQVLEANSAALRLFRTDIAGLGEFVSSGRGRIDPAERARRSQVLTRDGHGTFRSTGLRPDGSTFPQEVDIKQMAIGGEDRWLVLTRDLSTEEHLQQELLQAQKMEAIGQLVSGVAHELNNPLAAIIAFSQLLRSDERLPEDMKHDADLLVQEADRTRRIVRNLLDFARQRPPERHPTSIRHLIESVLTFHSYNMAAGRITVELSIPRDLPHVDVDRAQLQQVLLNLTLNAIQAIKAHQPSGTIRIAAEERRREDGTPAIRVSVTDDGPGVPAAIRSRIFLPFFTTKEPGQGTGLGLSVSFGIVASHGGSLWLDDRPEERGARFVMDVPISAAAEGRPERSTTGHEADRDDRPDEGARMDGTARLEGAEVIHSTDRADGGDRADGTDAAERHSPTGRSMASDRVAARGGASERPGAFGPGGATGAPKPHVLVLDDEPSIRAFLTKALQLGGFEATVVEAGRRALEFCERQAFDAVLIDHRMPGMPGTEVYLAAVAIQPSLRGRVILMSGDVLNPDLRSFADSHGIGLLAKPFDVDTVIRAVAEASRRPLG